MVSSSFHSAFDLMALSCALFAMLNAKYPARGTPFSYGLDRQEVVSAFTNAVFLFFVATFMIIETFHTAYSPPELEQSDVVVALVSLAVDALGLVLFNKYMTFRHASDESAVAVAAAAAAAAGSNTSAAGIWTHGGSSAPLLGSGSSGALVSSSSSSSTSGPVLLGANSARGHYENMHGVALHVMADLVGHASLLSAIWIHASFPSFTLIFALSFLLSALLTIRLVLPLFRATGAVLLMTTPVHLRLALDRAMREVSFYDGVLELRSAHWWTHAPGVVVGSMHVRIRSDAEEQTILAYVHSVLRKYCALLTVQIEKDQMPAHWNTHVLQS
jgi:zinc transporter 5/7